MLYRLSKAQLDKNEDLLTNPSLGLGVSELTAALRQQRPRRPVATLPVVESDSSLHGGSSNTPRASDSPGLTSPFAALAHSPHHHGEAVLADGDAEGTQQHAQHLQSDAQQAADGASVHQEPVGLNQEPTALSNEQDVDDRGQGLTGKTASQPEDAGAQSSELGSDLQRNSSSTSSRQSFRRKGRPKCTVM